jgi:hypothetical protein
MVHDPERDLLGGDTASTAPESIRAEAADTPLGSAALAADLEACDAAYALWRDEHLKRLDEDYAAWRETGAKKFPEDFDAWRQARRELVMEQSAAGLPLVAATDEAPERVKASLLFERS